MAATIARAQGFTKDGIPMAHAVTRLGGGAAKANADTWRTFVTAYVRADGSGSVEVMRDGKLLHTFGFDAEPESSA